MKGDLILRIMMSFFIPFLLLFGFFSIASYRIIGFYSFAVSLLYFLLAYILSFLRHKTITPKNLVMFKAFGKILLGLFVIFLIYVLMILLNFNIPFIL